MDGSVGPHDDGDVMSGPERRFAWERRVEALAAIPSQGLDRESRLETIFDHLVSLPDCCWPIDCDWFVFVLGCAGLDLTNAQDVEDAAVLAVALVTTGMSPMSCGHGAEGQPAYCAMVNPGVGGPLVDRGRTVLDHGELWADVWVCRRAEEWMALSALPRSPAGPEDRDDAHPISVEGPGLGTTGGVSMTIDWRLKQQVLDEYYIEQLHEIAEENEDVDHAAFTVGLVICHAHDEIDELRAALYLCSSRLDPDLVISKLSWFAGAGFIRITCLGHSEGDDCLAERIHNRRNPAFAAGIDDAVGRTERWQSVDEGIWGFRVHFWFSDPDPEDFHLESGDEGHATGD